MHPRTKKRPTKDKKIAKPFKNSHKAPDSLPRQEPQQSLNIAPVQTPEDLRKQLAKQALSKLHEPAPLVKDDFFVMEGEESKKFEQDAHDQQAELLRQQYLRKQNKLFQNISLSFSSLTYEEPIQYKGHKLCITAFEVTPQHIYSCSKDKSIIKWDRETKKKDFISLGKDSNHHRSDILTLALHSNHNVIATAGDDCVIKLWDTRSLQLIETLRGHKNTINGLKFGMNSQNLCSVSADLTFKQWDCSQRGLIGTFYEHNAEVLDIDALNEHDFLTSGYDKQVVAWKTQKETKVVFKGHQYAIDRVRAINTERFVTGCQDGSIYLWHNKKTKPVFKMPQAHPKGWISALDNIKQTNIVASAGIDRVVKIWGVEGAGNELSLLKQVQVEGIVTDLKLTPELLAVTECDELRLGRWVTDKCRNKIKIFNARKE